MRQLALCLLLATTFAAGPALAHEGGHWRTLNGDQIRVALDDKTYEYTDGAQQFFMASGRTLYNAGQDRWGRWDVRNGQYCSQWPPADGWTCYDVQGDEDTGNLRFFAGDDSFSEGRRID